MTCGLSQFIHGDRLTGWWKNSDYLVSVWDSKDSRRPFKDRLTCAHIQM